ncbi:hypothetical protein ASD11_10635 [Aeromicrobium sp. Root495]|uniref:TPM domain-containing protein n=1 Tax=Aeromicrobium sp. Root495 TaxID=1736550 RepID=UPI0006F80A2F|nr:TPM domain-containing protein [Aeromicrobium sp. Root495]KQY59952.1 hypothetical protein ASD11_10635 [Aeromicrobium sp. Root495]
MQPSPRASITSPLLALALAVCVLLVPSSAEAEGVDVSGQVTDSAGVLGADRSEVREATRDFYEETGRKLFVVLVPTFGSQGGAEFVADTVRRSRLGSADVVLAIATDTRQSELTADTDDFAASDRDRVRAETVQPAVEAGEWAEAVTEGAEQLADARDSRGFPWLWIVLGVLVLLLVVAVAARRYRRGFERTHHVQDEHGRTIDPAAILGDDEIEDAADRALVTVDDALLASFEDLDHLEADAQAPGRAKVPAWRTTLTQLRADLDEALAQRSALDDEPSATRRRAASSAILSVCDRVDRALDELEPQVREGRDLRNRAAALLTALEARLDELGSRSTSTPDPLTQVLEGAARAAVTRARAADDPADRVADLRVAEAAAARLAALPQAEGSVETHIAVHRGAVGVLARARRAAGDEHGAREQMSSDLSTWERPDDGGIEGLWALARTGAVVEAPDQHRIGSVLGGSTHGSGGNAPFPGSERPDRFVATGFGGHRSVDRRPTITRL